LRTFEALIVKPLPADVLGVPLQPIAGKQPSEFSFAVQYVFGTGHPTRAMLRSILASIWT
jgi:hypothetical protein